MDRRNFIKTTSLSLGTLLITDYSFLTNDDKKSIINLPDEVSSVINEKPVKLGSRNKVKWTTVKGVAVELINRGTSGMVVSIAAPKAELSEVTLCWKIPFGSKSAILNDHWERTYGDVSWHNISNSEILPWYFLESDGQVTSGFGVKTNCKSFCYWKIENGKLSLTLDTRSGGKGVVLGKRVLEAAEVVTLKGNPDESSFQTGRKFIRLMCNQARLPKLPVYGINDWYYCYGNNSGRLILELTEIMSSMSDNSGNKPFSVIDDGWFKGNDLSAPNQKFSDMAHVADAIRQRGMCPGIWTRPLISNKGKFKSGSLLPNVLGRSNDKCIIDPTIPENLEIVKSYFRTYHQWGYELVKFDYTSFDIFGRWGFEMLNKHSITCPDWSMYDRSVTNAEIITALYRAIRSAADDMYIIGCNTFSHLSAGLFELNRIGDDTSGKEWGRTLKMGVNTLAFRGIQHNLFYSADADCVGLTQMIPWEKNKQWMKLVAMSGTPLFISAQPEALGNDQKKTIKECFRIASGNLPTAEPLDWMENKTPAKWKLNGEVVEFNWI